jgi:hypothetical protein
MHRNPSRRTTPPARVRSDVLPGRTPTANGSGCSVGFSSFLSQGEEEAVEEQHTDRLGATTVRAPFSIPEMINDATFCGDKTRILAAWFGSRSRLPGLCSQYVVSTCGRRLERCLTASSRGARLKRLGPRRTLRSTSSPGLPSRWWSDGCRGSAPSLGLVPWLPAGVPIRSACSGQKWPRSSTGRQLSAITGPGWMAML